MGPKPSRSMKEISDESDFAKSELIKKQLENTNKIKELRRRLNQGGNGEEERAYRWGGENRCHDGIDGKVLAADFAVTCYEAEHALYLIVAVALLGLCELHCACCTGVYCLCVIFFSNIISIL